jgi:hypothetical protein
VAKRKKPAGWHTTQNVVLRYWDSEKTKPVKVLIQVDWDTLAYALAKKAERNKSGKSKLSVGIVGTIIE